MRKVIERKIELKLEIRSEVENKVIESEVLCCGVVGG